ncbi:Uncharacterized iron-regulated membrane protein [Arachidicoccus rhizosphaerae]|uniref:Uncharacterized iron-regulated membrane protein n=1 Tax=Arachidicoccus rhizosphaerae TaxID=551991 RepID=A0A1H3XRG8_9BACT|nr:PepSY-associated TM helix domain-containing protein [Arachidicoccus rhizosphaerae]SEA02055.1 Uncharacterized iron-regulated membrane protein [Arachidicoccus rhizosphaerae]
MKGEKKSKKSKKSVFSRVNAWLHLWLGIFSGVILVFVALTGTMVVYGDEIIDWSAGSARYVQNVSTERLPMEKLMVGVTSAYPQAKLSEVTVYKDPHRSVRFRAFSKEQGLAFAYVNPYNGAVLKYDNTGNFFFVVAHLHSSFLWHGPGTWIVDIATIIFLIELISGIVLWWPKKWTKKTRDDSFKIRWKARFKRVNYDLHNVLGFYSSILALILTVTGLIIAFKPVFESTAQIFGGDIQTPWQKQMPKAEPALQAVPLNQVINAAFTEHPQQRMAQVWIFNISKEGYYTVFTGSNFGLKSSENSKINFYDKVSGRPISIPEKSLRGEYVENYVWQLHMGTWMGQVGKLFTFLCGLICTSLPITGFLIWWHRGRKKKKKSFKQPLPHKKRPEEQLEMA